MDLDDLCRRLFDGFVAHDLDLVESMLAPGATITQNGNTMAWFEAKPVIAGLFEALRDHRYVDVRRVVAERAVVEEHTVTATFPDGRAVRVPACVVVRVDDEGRITEIDEYADTAALA